MLYRIVKYFRDLFYVQLVSAPTYIHLGISLERQESEPDTVPAGGSRRSPLLFSALSLSRIRPGPPCPPPGSPSLPSLPTARRHAAGSYPAAQKGTHPSDVHRGGSGRAGCARVGNSLEPACLPVSISSENDARNTHFKIEGV